MGFFDKFKKKVSDTVEKTVEKTSEAIGFNRLKEGLEKTRKSFSDKISNLLKGRKIDQELLDDIEDILITSDIGVDTSEKLIEKLKERVKKEQSNKPKPPKKEMEKVPSKKEPAIKEIVKEPKVKKEIPTRAANDPRYKN